MSNLIAFLGYGVAMILFIWVTKRISWSFHPFFSDPRSPPFVPYIIPLLGSGFSFGKDPIKFIQHWTKELKSNIICAYMGGMKIIFVADQYTAAQLISGKVPQLTWNEMKLQILRNGFNVSEEGSQLIANDKDGHAIWDQYLMKSSSLEEIMQQYQVVLKKKIMKSTTMINKSWSSQSIIDFFCKMIYSTTTELLLGYPSMATDEFYDLALKFDKDIFHFIGESKPKNQQKKRKIGYDARERLAAAVRNILVNKEDSQNTDKPSPLMKAVMEHFSKLNLEDEVHRQLTVLWASFVNAIPATFWLVFNLLSHKDAYLAVKNEVLSIYEERVETEKKNGKKIEDDGDCNFTLSDIERMVKLESILMETFRLTTTPKMFSFRGADEDFEIKLNVNEKVKKFFVKKGTVFLMSNTLDHRDDEIFKDALEFKWDRFVPGPDGRPPVFTKNGRRLLRPVNPFGGGSSMCPGRRFAIAEIKSLIATLLLSHDVRFADDKIPEAPGLVETSPITTSAFPVSDVKIEVKKMDA